MDISIVIPLYNEEDSLPELCEWCIRVLKDRFSFEIIFVDDGSKDKSWEIIETLQGKYDCVKGVKFRRNYGKSAGLNAGFGVAKGDVVITMDADLQDSPDEIPDLYNMIMTEGYDLVSGWKKKRYDPLSKTIPTKLYNWANRKMSGIELHDFNCGLKAYRIDLVKSIEVYGEMHRYIPVIAKWAGFGKIGEKVVQHRARKYGKSKFGLERFVNGFLDLFTINFVSKFGKKPMHLFGTLGLLLFLIGFLFAAWLGVYKLFINPISAKIAERPEFYLSLVTMMMGSQFFMTGFIAELIIKNSEGKNSYLVEKII